ncbi:hypothetical protein DT075_15550 [Bacillus licheniformis]|nr:hypothetical protein DT075_15550 [Bacillus licheniformis]
MFTPQFYHQYLLDAERFGDKRGLWAKPDIPPNTFSVSSIPWVSFTNFNLNLDNSEHLLPIITNGKYFSEGKKKIKLYPAFIYIVSRVIHSRPEFRTTFDDKGRLGYWEQMHPCYAIFHQDDQTFSALWTEYSDDFSRILPKSVKQSS